MSDNQLDKDGLPCVVEGDNQISEGLPESSYVEKQIDEQMEKMM